MKMKICEHCKSQPATVHLTDINGSVKKETHLCAHCAAAKGLNLTTASALPNLIGALAQGAKRRAAPADDGPACPRCGISWSEFRAKGRFGCPNDYTVSRERLNELLYDMHGRDPVHVGRAPDGAPPPTPRPAPRTSRTRTPAGIPPAPSPRPPRPTGASRTNSNASSTAKTSRNASRPPSPPNATRRPPASATI